MLLRYRTVIAVFQGIVRLLRKLSIGSQGIPPYISNALRRRLAEGEIQILLGNCY